MLGILTGRGNLPVLLTDHLRTVGEPYFLLGFDGETPRETLEGHPHGIVKLGQIGKAVSTLRKAGVKTVTLAGGIRKPNLSNLGLDLTGIRLMARIGAGRYGGDDAVLSAVVDFLEEEGFVVIGVDEVMPGLVAPSGLIASVPLPPHADRDLEVGIAAAKALGARDAGQAVVVRSGDVVGEEDADGTDALLARCAGSGGVLVKASKPGQENRADLPAIGEQTIARLGQLGYEGVAVEAGASLVIGRERVAEEAKRLGVYVRGFEYAA